MIMEVLNIEAQPRENLFRKAKPVIVISILGLSILQLGVPWALSIPLPYLSLAAVILEVVVAIIGWALFTRWMKTADTKMLTPQVTRNLEAGHYIEGKPSYDEGTRKQIVKALKPNFYCMLSFFSALTAIVIGLVEALVFSLLCSSGSSGVNFSCAMEHKLWIALIVYGALLLVTVFIWIPVVNAFHRRIAKILNFKEIVPNDKSKMNEAMDILVAYRDENAESK